jgi:hypothetical protein
MKEKHGQTDDRYRGHEDFKYFVECQGKPRFKELCLWCIKVWGHSIELDIWDESDNIHWCWLFENYPRRYRIYLRDDAEYLWFKLKWT